LASNVGADGSVLDPYGTEPSIDWTINLALALAASGEQPDVLVRMLDHIRSNADEYITSGTSDPAGHLAWLILLATRSGEDPTDFGGTHLDLVTALRNRYAVAEAGLFGTVDVYTAATNQALSILALIASGAEVAPDAIDWLLAQQCTGPAGQAGAWQGHRAEATPGVLSDCLPTSSAAYERADAATTSFAVMALAAWRARGHVAPGVDASITAAVDWLRSMQARTGSAAGGFGQYVGDPADPNSTALAILAIISAGTDPATWTVTDGDPVGSLRSWIITTGPEAGAFRSPYSSGSADLFATYQGLWGLAGSPFPLDPLGIPAPPPVVTEAPTDVVTPSFTG
jgi:hypothetical protein